MGKEKERCVVCQDGWKVKYLAEMKIEKAAQLNPALCKTHIEEISNFLRAKLDKKIKEAKQA